jgi:hypothetical protein
MQAAWQIAPSSSLVMLTDRSAGGGEDPQPSDRAACAR